MAEQTSKLILFRIVLGEDIRVTVKAHDQDEALHLLAEYANIVLEGEEGLEITEMSHPPPGPCVIAYEDDYDSDI